MSHHVAYEYDAHVVACVRDGLFAGSEDVQYVVQEYQADDGEQKSHHQVECDGVAQDILCHIIFSLSQSYAYDCACSHSYHGSEGCSEVHERTGHGHAADTYVAHSLSHEYAVHDIVYR